MCYSDHNEDIRLYGSCSYCHSTAPQALAYADQFPQILTKTLAGLAFDSDF